MLFSYHLTAQNGSNEKIYKHFGEWEINNNDNRISISAYITVNKTYEKITPYEIEMEKRLKRKRNANEIKKYDTTYKYRIYLKSNTVLNEKTVQLWIHGGKIFINGIEITKERFPNGFLAPIRTKPTLIYEYKTTLTKKLNFYIKWNSITYGTKK